MREYTIKMINKFIASKRLAAILSAIIVVVYFVLLFTPLSAQTIENCIFPLLLLMGASCLFRDHIIPLCAAAICILATAFSGKLTSTVFEYPVIEGLLAAILISIFAHLLCKSGVIQDLAVYIANKTQTRRAFFKSLFLFGTLFSFFPEVGAAITGSLFGETGAKLGISREKTAMFANITSATLWTMFFAGVWTVHIIPATKTGLDLIGGQTIPVFPFLTTTIQYNFFAQSCIYVLLLSAFNMKDMGFLYTKECEARKSLKVEHLKQMTDPKKQKSAIMIIVIPVLVFIVTFFTILILVGQRNPAGGDESLLYALYSYVHSENLGSAMLIAAAAMLLCAALLVTATRRSDMGTLAVQRGNGKDLHRIAETVLRLIVALGVMRYFSALDIYNKLADKISLEVSTLFIPCMCFAFSLLIAFSSGNFSVACVLVIPYAVSICWNGIQEPIYYTMATGSVFSGALAGMLLSPFSVQNILAAESCGCDFAAHMKSQCQYVLLSAAISCVFGFFPLSFGFGTTFGLALVFGASYAALDTFGKKADRVVK